MAINELILDKEYKKDSKGKRVKIIQEWLCLHDIHISIDSNFGPATEEAVKQFQHRVGLATTGIVDDATYPRLVDPMVQALSDDIQFNETNLGMTITAFAEQHLQHKPREIGGQNMGPWVRLYMNGNEGAQWPWCAGFACFILKKACKKLGISVPINTSFSCDSLAADAKSKGFFVGENQVTDKNYILPGSFFLSRRTPTDWVHTGIVISVNVDHFETIEGNTNDDGDREGYEVCKRIRGYDRKDFIVFG